MCVNLAGNNTASNYLILRVEFKAGIIAVLVKENPLRANFVIG